MFIDDTKLCLTALRNPSGWLCYRGADKSLARADWKKQVKVRHFSSDEVIAAAVTWLDGQISVFFWVACKSYSLVALAFFLPGRAKDFSAPRYYNGSIFREHFYTLGVPSGCAVFLKWGSDSLLKCVSSWVDSTGWIFFSPIIVVLLSFLSWKRSRTKCGVHLREYLNNIVNQLDATITVH